jgi:hypothetical protein
VEQGCRGRPCVEAEDRGDAEATPGEGVGRRGPAYNPSSEPPAPGGDP